jgi:glycosyltransferase A (GT-A) superfamily protein (DUF2064 family)
MQRARDARLGLAADLRDIQQVGGRLIRTSEQKLKSSAVVLGIAVLGGVVIGLALARSGKHKRVGSGDSASAGLLAKAVAAIGARVATQLLSKVVENASSRAHLTG